MTPRKAKAEIVTENLAGMVTAGHLGGYIKGGDPSTFYPALWDWLVREERIRSVLDIGCGDGVALRYFRDLGVKVTGIDGVPQEERAIHTHDYTLGVDPLKKSRGYDVAWSCEFLEHVEARYLPNVAFSFQRAPLVLITHADPGQPGHHHVNCQPASYWIGWFSAVGFTLDEETTALTRKLAAMNPAPDNHYARSGLVFRKDR